MIAYLEGRLAENASSAIVLVTPGGVGYEIEVSAVTRQGLPQIGEQVALHTVLFVREDSLRLCGFASKEEKEMFCVLVNIPKVGPKLALSVLSVYSPKQLQSLVVKGDSNALAKVPGIGKRSAETMLRELAYKLGTSSAKGASDAAGMPPAFKTVMDGLVGLGYGESECVGVVQGVFKENPDIGVSEALRASLKALARKR